MAHWRPRHRLTNLELQRGMTVVEGGMTQTQVATALGSIKASSRGRGTGTNCKVLLLDATLEVTIKIRKSDLMNTT